MATTQITIVTREKILIGALAVLFGTGGGFGGVTWANKTEAEKIKSIETKVERIEKSLAEQLKTMSVKVDDTNEKQQKFERSLGKIEGMLEIIIRQKSK